MLISKRAGVKSDKPAYEGKEKSESGNVIYHYGPAHIDKRWKLKKDKLKKLEKELGKVRSTYKADLKSDDERTRAIAAIVGIMDETSMRIGNEASSKEGTYGATTLKVKHIKMSGGKMKFDFPGKGAIEQHVELSDSTIIKTIKDLMKGKSANDFIFEVDGKKIWDRAVNRYLSPLGISAKDLRGFHANRLMKEMLKKKDFKVALEEVAEIVGHEAATLKNQYLDPELVAKYEGKGEDKKDKDDDKKKDKKKKASSNDLLRLASLDDDDWRYFMSKKREFSADNKENAVPSIPSAKRVELPKATPQDRQLGRQEKETLNEADKPAPQAVDRAQILKNWNINSGVKLNYNLLKAWSILFPYLPSSSRMTSGIRNEADQRRVINNYWRSSGGSKDYPSITDDYEKSRILRKRYKLLVGPPASRGRKPRQYGHGSGNAFDVSGANLDQIAAAVRMVSEDPDIPIRCNPLIERQNNAVHVTLISVDSNPTVKKKKKANEDLIEALVKSGAPNEILAAFGSEGVDIDKPRDEFEPGDWFERQPKFRDYDAEIDYVIHDVKESEASKLAKSDPETFFYRGLHREHKDLEAVALKCMLKDNANFYFIFRYHERDEEEFKDLLQEAAEKLSQQNVRAFFYFRLHHKFPELGRGAIVQLIDTNPESYHEFGLGKDYPDYLASAQDAINIEDPSRTKVVVVEDREGE